MFNLAHPETELSQGPRAFYPLARRGSVWRLVPVCGLWKHRHWPFRGSASPYTAWGEHL